MEKLVRIKCTVAYDGSNYYGFQIQPNNPSIQEEIQLALFKIHKEKITIHASGRTDRGVHANNQVFHFDSSLSLTTDQWKKALNSNLPNDIYIKNVEVVSDEFHSRFSVRAKTYIYILNTNDFNPISKDYVYQYNRFLDINKMSCSAKLFVGTHDFRNFCSNSEDEVRDFIKTIESFDISINDGIITFKVTGSGFLRYMVRMMVGTLIEIGSGRKKDDIITSRLDNLINDTISYNAPSEGLYLDKIYY